MAVDGVGRGVVNVADGLLESKKMSSNSSGNLRTLSLIQLYWLWRKGEVSKREIERRRRVPRGTMSRLFRERIDTKNLKRYGTRWLAALVVSLFPEEWAEIEALAKRRKIRVPEVFALLGCTEKDYYTSEYKEPVKFLSNKLSSLSAYKENCD